MSLKEKAAKYYLEQGKHCPEAIIFAANDEYNLGITAQAEALFTGFRTGMGCGATCGSLIGAVAVISMKYADREDIKELCAGFVTAFEKKMGCGATDCATIAAKYKTEAARCVAGVELAAEALEEYIAKIDGTDKAPAGEGCTLSPEDIKRVKGMGFLNHKGTNKFNGRIITRNGKITADEAAAMSEAAAKFGDGHMMLTTRLTMEISGIDYDDIPAFVEFVEKAGMETGGTGSKVRPVVSCKGTTCQYGTYDTYALSDKLHQLFYKGYRGVTLPHKFKIAVGGCPNNCVKPNLNDLGITGVKVPQYDPEICKGCKKCQIEAACPVKAAQVIDGKLVIDPEKCNNCGRCVAKCPFHCADEGQYGWRVYIGGRWGKKVAHGRMISKIFTSEQEVIDVVEKAILLFRSEGIPGERLADTVERIGMERTEELLLGNELFEKKAEILGACVVGGASC